MVKLVVRLLISSAVATAADFCAVKIFLTGKGGTPASALVELRDITGKVVQRSTADEGEADFCDFDFGECSIAIGGTTCAALIIPNVELVFGATRVYRAYLNDCAGGEEFVPKGCRINFRVVSSRQDPVPTVTLLSDPPGIKTTTDNYGRAQVRVASGETRKLVFSKQGYSPTEYALKCDNPRYAHERITITAIR